MSPSRQSDLSDSRVETLIGLRNSTTGRKMVVIEWKTLLGIILIWLTLLEGGKAAVIKLIQQFIGAG